MPTDRPPPDSNPERKELEIEIQEYIAGLVVAVESRLEEKITNLIMSAAQQIETMNNNLGEIADNTKALVASTEVLKGMGNILMKAHEENLSLARELGIIWSERERARLEGERNR